MSLLPLAPGAPRAESPGVSPRPPPFPHEPRPFPLAATLDRTADFDAVFRVVRGAVHYVLGQERPGLGLALSNLPPAVGAYWQIAGNVIVMNEGLLRAMREHATSTREFNSFVYVILAHEYLHSIGYIDERSVRQVTARVTRAAFGPDHPATHMAEGDLWQMYPFLSYAAGGDGSRIRIVPRFDLASTQTYIR
ncbi:MAG: hypothetical protein WAN74_05415 [Thermoplasmata archaeon]